MYVCTYVHMYAHKYIHTYIHMYICTKYIINLQQCINVKIQNDIPYNSLYNSYSCLWGSYCD